MVWYNTHVLTCAYITDNSNLSQTNHTLKGSYTTIHVISSKLSCTSSYACTIMIAIGCKSIQTKMNMQQNTVNCKLLFPLVSFAHISLPTKSHAQCKSTLATIWSYLFWPSKQNFVQFVGFLTTIDTSVLNPWGQGYKLSTEYILSKTRPQKGSFEESTYFFYICKPQWDRYCLDRESFNISPASHKHRVTSTTFWINTRSWINTRCGELFSSHSFILTQVHEFLDRCMMLNLHPVCTTLW